MKQVGETSTLAPVQVANEAVTIKKLLSDHIKSSSGIPRDSIEKALDSLVSIVAISWLMVIEQTIVS
jgi:hypothetical protein